MSCVSLPRPRLGWPVLFVALAALAGCGNGCSCLAPIPGGFPSEERSPNAVQLRISQQGLTDLTADPGALIGGALGGPLEFDVPAQCSGTVQTCCPGGNPVTPCGPIQIDLAEMPGDLPRLVVTPVENQRRLDVVVRARVRTEMPVPIRVPLVGDCTLSLDTMPGSFQDLKVTTSVVFGDDPAAGTTRITVGDVAIEQLETSGGNDDVTIGGGFLCAGADILLTFLQDTLVSTFRDAIKSAVEDQLCKQCPSGDVAECGPFAAACTDNVCTRADDSCLQEIGVSGRLAAEALFAGLSPGTSGAIDLYEVAGGYSTTNGGGVALGLLGGLLPAGDEHARCGPPATAPAPVTIPVSTFFQGNTRPDTSAPFDLAVGIHESQLDEFAHAAYDGGLLCLTIGTSTVDLLTTNTFSLVIPSLTNLVERSSPMAIGLRPQRPPVFVLGRNTFVDDGNGGVDLDEPLLDITFTGLQIDFFAAVDDQYIRLFTLTTDLHLPLGLQVGDTGELTPVLGDLDGAFSNLVVTNSEPLVETPADLEAVLPTLLDLALPQLAGGLGAIALPEVAGLQIAVDDITAVDGATFLALFGQLSAAMPAPAPRVDTRATLAGVTVPKTHVFADATRWTGPERPTVALELDADGADGAPLEWAVRVDGGLWSAWSQGRHRVVSTPAMWLQGRHTVEVRARVVGRPETTDRTPAVLRPLIDTLPPVPALQVDDGLLRITATDNVPDARLRARYRFPGEAWVEAALPADVALAGRSHLGLEVQVLDESGNLAPTRGATAIAADFHGQASGEGCGCDGSGAAGAGNLALLLLAAAGLGLRGRRRAAVPAGRLLRGAAVVVAAGALPACDCGGDPPCGPVECMEGEVEPGALGRFNGVASDGTRTVISTYDQGLGDLVLVELPADGGDPAITPLDGIPGDPPSYDPSGYRGGIAGDGPDVGAYTSIVLHDGLARIAYQDRDNGDLKVAVESADGWLLATLDGDDGDAGYHTSMAVLPDGTPVIAYLATGIDADGGTGKQTELRLARATSPTPSSNGDWTITTVASAPSTCAGLCGDRFCVADDTGAESCQAESGDCGGGCTNTEACIAGACTAVLEPGAADLPRGTGLFPTVLVRGGGALAIVHYDRVATALVAELESAPGAGAFTPTVLDGADGADRGMWASAAIDAGGTIHVVYQDALRDQVLYTSLAPDGTPGTPELVDDGLRAPDRPHNVGAGAAIWLDGTVPTAAYQDGMTADLVVASRGAGTWSHEGASTGPLVDGFHIAASTSGGWVVWDQLDPTRSPPHSLQYRQSP